MPTEGKAAASTALPHPPSTSHKVPKNSAVNLLLIVISKVTSSGANCHPLRRGKVSAVPSLRPTRPGSDTLRAAGGRPPLLLAFEHKFEGHVVLVDVAHVGDRLAPDLPVRDQLHVVEPLVRVEPFGRGLLPQPRDAVRPRVV